MRQLAAQLADAERVAREAETMLARRTEGAVRPPPGHEHSMLSDTHGRHHNYLRISLTERCNLRCVYCMPEDGVDLQPQSKMINQQEILRLASMFVDAGVDKIRLTGGEPLVRKDLPDIVRALSSLEGVRNVGVTTNGINLKRKIPALREAGLTHINVSLDTLQPDRFAAITRRKGLDTVLASLDAALAHGYGGRLKINCVVMNGVNTDELADFLEFTRDQEIDVRFIEWMPFDDNRWKDAKFFSYQSMLDVIRERYPDLERTVDSANDTTKWHRVPGYRGRVGFITSMSEHFCGTCNRLRITSDGNLKVCLFGDESLSLRDALRGGLSDAEISVLVRAAVLGKRAALGGHGDMYGIANAKNRPMTTIGG
ncbi:conserved unknown protein [Ectocarpus siliculosus]|uniref:GTP 3',8-cyclase n=1 Tax=Ectocarpus siliculosus TaxID=2880 RepID=D7FKR1_ECTSI|nr:conserved unknown protein [Ectocarpus siliculosus]|eukprot:CBJ29460.1 conserved unknown protein [Ectocarpus siliculosus]